MPFTEFLQTSSIPRSSVYERVFRAETDEETCGSLLWGQHMSMALHALMVTVEVALRNRIHRSLSIQATEKRDVTSESFPWYDHLLVERKLEGETYSKVEAILCGPNQVRLQKQPPPDRVVARLSFGVWSNILDQQLPLPQIEVRTFSDVFPHHPKAKKHWKYIENRKVAVNSLKDLRGWRNRIAHCKPVWSEGWYRSSDSQHWSEVIDRIHSRREGVLEILNWICPSTLEIYRRSSAGKIFSELATQESVFAHIKSPFDPNKIIEQIKIDRTEINAYKARP